MNYEDIVGQQKLVESLRKSIADATFPHAIMLIGKPGYGILSIALAASKHLLCRNPVKYGACGECLSCHQMSKLIHPDFHVAFPVVKKAGRTRKETVSADFLPEWRDVVLNNPYTGLNTWLRKISTTSSKGDINVAECNRIVQEMNLKSYSGGRKIQVIWMAEHLGKNGNKLLKLIEEPPENTHLILLAEDADSILRTIQSRCQIIRVPRLDDEDLKSYLVSSRGIDIQRSSEIANIADGDLEKALQYSEVSRDATNAAALQWLSVARKGEAVSIRDWVDQFDSYNLEEQKIILEALLKILRSTLHARYGLPSKQMSEPRGMGNKGIHSVLRSSGIDQVTEMVSIVEEALMLLERNVHGKILLFNASLRLHRILEGRLTDKMTQ